MSNSFQEPFVLASLLFYELADVRETVFVLCPENCLHFLYDRSSSVFGVRILAQARCFDGGKLPAKIKSPAKGRGLPSGRALHELSNRKIYHLGSRR